MKTLPDRITVDPQILGGKPVIRGLRISVEQVPNALAAGVTRENILADYPDLENEDIQAMLAFAALLVEDTRIFSRSA